MADNKLKISFYGGSGEVTGANFLISSASGEQILVDCGLFQSGPALDRRNWDPFPFDPKEIAYLFVTHPHIDHTGRIPSLVRQGFSGVIYSTPPTRQISTLMLEDSFELLEGGRRSENLEPLYQPADIAQALKLWQTLPYHQTLKKENFYVSLGEAGHTLGSAIIEFVFGQTRVVFSGDLGNSPSPLLPDTDQIKGAHYLVIESVYGDRLHEDREKRKHLLEDTIEETIHRSGTLLVPAFSLERTQEVLHEIESLMEADRIPLVPVIVDSPLASGITEVYRKYRDYLKPEAFSEAAVASGLFHFPQLIFTESAEESRGISKRFQCPKIIIAGSGMSSGGRIVFHERQYLPDEKNTLLLLGYQAPGSLGRRLAEGEKKVNLPGEEIIVRAQIVSIPSYSGHPDRKGLLNFILPSVDTLKKVFVVMGEPHSSLFLVQRIRDYLGIDAYAPTAGESVEIEA